MAHRQLTAAVGALVIFALCLSVAVCGSLGFIAHQKAGATGTAAAQADHLKSLLGEVAQKAARRSVIGTVESTSIIALKIDGAKLNWLHARSKQCTDATGPDSRTFCVSLKDLEADLARAREADALDQALATLRGRIEALGSRGRNETDDVQSALIAKVTGWQLWNIQLWQQLLFVAMIEAGACLMLHAAINHGQSARVAVQSTGHPSAAPRRSATEHDRPRLAAASSDTATAQQDLIEAVAVPVLAKPNIPLLSPTNARIAHQSLASAPRHGDVAVFMETMCITGPADCVVIRQDQLISGYQAWCNAKEMAPHDAATVINIVCMTTGIARRRHGDGIYLLGVELRPSVKRRKPSPT